MRKATERTMYEVLLSSMSLEHLVLAECLAMAKHAFSSGMKVPGWLAERLEAIATQELNEEVKPSIALWAVPQMPGGCRPRCAVYPGSASYRTSLPGFQPR